MRSSTSSSRSRNEDLSQAWRRTLALALAVVAVGTLSFEMFWRARGFEPSLRDDDALWSLTHKQLALDDPDAIAVIGSSRIFLAIQPREFARSGLAAPVQLAITMAPSTPMLEYLGRETSFRGVILAEVNQRMFFDEQRRLDKIVRSKIRASQRFDRADAFEQRLRMLLQKSTVSRLPELSAAALRRAVESRSMPTPPYISLEADRTRIADFDRFPGLERRMRRIRKLREASAIRFLRGAALGRWLDRVEASVVLLRERGGEVFFIQPPISGFILQDEAESLPRTHYWDALAAHTSGATIHFEDYPSLREFSPVDGDHLGGDQAAAFSRALGAIVAEKLRERRPRRG